MAEQVLLRFLNAGLLNVNGDDEKLQKLQETASDLAAALKKEPSKAPAFALIALDPNSPDDDPVVKEAAEALKKRWATYVNTFAGTPVAVLRAVLLEALTLASASDDHIGLALVASARNILPFVEASNERAIWFGVVADIEHCLDVRSESEWAAPDSIEIQGMVFTPAQPIKVSTAHDGVDEDALHEQLAAAAGPTNAAGEPTNGNRYLPNNPQPWVNDFSRLAAKAIAEAIETVAQAAQIKPIDLSPPLKSLAQTVSNHVDNTLKAVSAATTGLQRRTNLLWWKEALFSPSGRFSYRAMPAYEAAALMAFDLHQLVPVFSPASVTAFLHETVLKLPSYDPEQNRPIRELVEEAITSQELLSLRRTAIQLVPKSTGRRPILGLLAQGVAGRTSSSTEFETLVGVSASSPLTAPEWATWLFRELQAARATQEKQGAKKRGRKA